MKFTCTLRGEKQTLTHLEDAVAVRPSDAARASAPSAAALAKKFGGPAPDISNPAVSFGLGLPSKDLKIFRGAGWLFSDPSKQLREAADTRAGVNNAEAVRPVFLDRGGNTLIGSDRLVVRLPGKESPDKSLAKMTADGFIPDNRLNFAPNLYEVRFRSKAPFAEALAEAQSRTGYLYVEPSFLEVISGRAVPVEQDLDPPLLVQQWQHLNRGEGGRPGADIKSLEAWELTRGGPTPNGLNRPVRIAVIDNGMFVNHPNLKPAVARGSYFTDDGLGGSVFNPYRRGDAWFPKSQHGTFCLGMAGARPTSKAGLRGSAPESELLAVACLPDQVGSQVTLARAIAYAADPSTEDPNATPEDGADVIACSLGPNSASWTITSVLHEAIVTASTTGRRKKGVPIFWAVTNGSFEINRDKVASHPNVVAVGRSNKFDLADGSGSGPELAFLAPGAAVYSTREGNPNQGPWTGTSFATPLAAGVAGLVIARNPELPREEVVACLKASCDRIGDGTGDVRYVNGRHNDYGYGRLNARKAVRAAR
jgi:subtilisin family serine protease